MSGPVWRFVEDVMRSTLAKVDARRDEAAEQRMETIPMATRQQELRLAALDRAIQVSAHDPAASSVLAIAEEFEKYLRGDDGGRPGATDHR